MNTKQITDKLALLNSSWFMSLWKKGGEPYRNLLNEYLQTGNDRKFLKYIKKNYDFNEYDLETIKVDAQHLQNDESLTNERKMGEPAEKKTDKPIPNVTDEEKKQVDEEFNNAEPWNKSKEEPVEQEAEDDSPMYETRQIPTRKLSTGDVIPFEDFLWCVVKQINRNFLVIQELYSGRKKRFEVRNKPVIDVLTDDEVEQVVKDFKEQKLTNNLPQILRETYDSKF